MADFKNCKLCGTITSNGFLYCTQCLNSHNSFKIVREYLYEFPNSTATQVSDATGVSVSAILEFIRANKVLVINKVEEKEHQYKNRSSTDNVKLKFSGTKPMKL